MLRKLFPLATATCLGFALASWTLHADEKPAAPAAPTEQQMAEAMAKWQAHMTPGKEHAELATQEGEWTYLMEDFSAGPEAMKIEGKATQKMILGGRVLMAESSCNYMGMPMEGIQLVGYDNSSKEYWSVWLDNAGTGVAMSTGKETAPGVVTYTGTMTNPMTGKPWTYTAVHTTKDADQAVYEMAGPDMFTGEGESKLTMRITFNRKK